MPPTRARVALRLGWTLAGVALALALLVAVAIALGPTGATLDAALPDSPTLASLLALLAVIGWTWDAPRTFWRALLGHPRLPVRLVLGCGALLYAVALAVALIGRGPLSALLALAVALLASSIARRRITGLALLALAATVPAALVPTGTQSWIDGLAPLLRSSFDGRVWTNALEAASARPFGAGIGSVGSIGGIGVTAPLPAAIAQYPLALAELGLPGLVALLCVLTVGMIECWRAYQRLRPTSGEAGAVLAGSAACLFMLVLGCFWTPLREPLPAMCFWLLLGCANSTLGVVFPLDAPSAASQEHQEHQPEVALAETAEIERLRGYPLRVAYVLLGADAGETPLMLHDYLRALDRRRVTPLLISLGASPLLAFADEAAAWQVPQHDPAAVDLAYLCATSPLAAARWLSKTAVGVWLCARGDALCNGWQTLREWAGITRAAIELHPDLLVSTSAALHLPTLLAGRLAGVPVQWHARDIAPRRAQRLLNCFAPWTASVLVPSQVAARAYALRPLRQLGTHVRVLRSGIPLPDPLETASDTDRHQTRQSLSVADAFPLLAVVGPIGDTSGHSELLDAIALLREHYPRLRVLLATAALPPAADVTTDRAVPALESVAALRLRRAIAERNLSAHSISLGARHDVADLLAASDIAVFPAWHVPASRALLLAQARGVPIVAARAGVVPEQLAEAWGHALVAPQDGHALAHGIETVAEQLERYRIAARRNPGLVRDWFSAPVELGRLLAIYRTICAPEPPPRPARSPRLPIPRHKKAAPPRRRWEAALWAHTENE